MPRCAMTQRVSTAWSAVKTGRYWRPNVLAQLLICIKAVSISSAVVITLEFAP